LRNLPDDPEDSVSGGRRNLTLARELYAEAKSIFTRLQQSGSAGVVDDALKEIIRELASNQSSDRRSNGDGRADVA
jgi:hypothetical protein